MTCYHCNTENPENAVYCKNCGRRLDGMAVCAYCGKTTPQDGDFCIHCGFNRNMAYDGAALPMAGGYAARRERTPRADNAERTARREKIMTNIALACTILTILVSVVFVFLIGAAFGVSTGGVSAGAALGYDIFYFFGKAYDALPASGDDFMLQVGTTGTAFGTVCSVVGLVSVVACAVWSVVRICNVLTGRTDKGVLAPAAATHFAFLCAAMLFFLCISQNVTTAGVSTGLVMNGTTIAGIVLGAVFLLAAVVLSAVMWGTGSDKRRFAFRLTAGVLCTACAVAVIALLCGGAVGYRLDSQAEVSTKYGIYTFFTQLMTASASVSQSKWSAFAAMYNGCVFQAVVLLIAAVLFGVLCAAGISQVLASAGSDAGKRARRLMMAAALCAVVAGVLMLTLTSSYLNWMDNENLLAEAAAPALVIVFGVLLFAVSVVWTVKENAAEE